jgi:hypothetical protein
MERSKKVFRLLEIIYAKAIASESQNIRRKLCCGCKIYLQDRLMDEHETWEHGVCHEFMAAIKILNIEIHEDFAEHLTYLQEDPDLRFVKTLMYTYQHKNIQPLLQTLSDLSACNPEIDPPEAYAQCHFSSPPRYTYYIKAGTDEKFKSHETDRKKAYKNYLENRLQEHLVNYFKN